MLMSPKPFESEEIPALNRMTQLERRAVIPLHRELTKINRLSAKLAFDLARDPLLQFKHERHEKEIMDLKIKGDGKVNPRNLPRCKDCKSVYFSRFWKKKDLDALSEMAIEVLWQIHLFEETV